jgi:hypothetical protein
MVMKKLRRTIIIRDSDLHRLIPKFAKLYNHIDMEPMTYKGIQHENLITKLKNPYDDRIPTHRPLPRVYEDMLYREQLMYDRRYMKWSFTMDYPDGQIYVQSRHDRPKEPLYRVTLELDHG